jgi:hypothetical protein
MSEYESELEEMKQKVREDFQAANHEPVTAENLREMAKFCTLMTQDLVDIFLKFQEKFKQAALAFTQLADFLEKDGAHLEKAERRTHVENDPPVNIENIFGTAPPADPGPVVPKPT